MRKRFDNRSQFVVSYALAQAEDNRSDLQIVLVAHG
jgi:hypothetical protein